LSSSNAGSAVNFAAGTKDVFVTQPAERALYLNGAGTGVDAGAAAFTANGVVYASSTSALATGSALTFDGTLLTLGTSSGFPISGSKFQIGNDANAPLRLAISNQNAGASALVGIAFEPAGGGWKIDVPADTAGFVPPMYFKAGASTNVTFGYGGAVGIGYSSLNSVGSGGLAVAGNVGVGTASPFAKLQVVASSADYFNPQVMVGEASNATGKQLHIGYNTTANTGYIQAVHNGTGYKDLLLQPNGGNLGLGVTPSDWSSASRPALQLPNGAALFTRSGSTFLGQNFFYNNSDTGTYIANGFATIYNQASGQHQWFNAPSGTANNTAALTQAMTLDASGRLLIGGTTTYDFNGQSNLVVSGTANNSTITIASTTDGYLAFADGTAGTQAYVGRISYYHSLNQMDFWTNGTARMYLDSAGNLGLGVTPATVYGESSKFTIDATGKTNGIYINFNGTGADKQIFLTNGGNANCFVGTDNIAMTFGTGNTERARISSDGTFRVKGAGTAGSTDAFQVAGTAPADAARITSGGNLLVGTTSDNGYKFATIVAGSASFQNAITMTNATDSDLSIRIRTNETSFINSGNTAAFTFATNSIERARIDSSGNFIVGGTSAPLASSGRGNVTVNGSTDAIVNLTSGGTSRAWFFATSTNAYLSAASGIPIIFEPGGGEKARIDSSGNLLVSTTTASASSGGIYLRSKDVAGSSSVLIGHISATATGNSYAEFFLEGTGGLGSITQNGTTGVLYNVTSDYRLKTVIGPVANAGQRIDALQPVEYTWNASGERTRGFLAHQFQEVYAGSVSGTKDAVDAEGNPVYQSMQASTSEVIADLVAEIQDLRKRLAAAGI
jgi:hypothetical protein